MRIFHVIALAILLPIVVMGAWKCVTSPDVSQEAVSLDDDKIARLIRLKDEEKFEAHDYAPLGYTGVATPQEGAVARAAVNDVIESILARADGPIEARTVSRLIEQGMKRVSHLETEDRDRTAGYMIEIWYLLGFRGSIGRFAYGAAYQRPEGYAEPLPPGWKSPTEPRASAISLFSQSTSSTSALSRPIPPEHKAA